MVVVVVVVVDVDDKPPVFLGDERNGGRLFTRPSAPWFGIGQELQRKRS